MACSGAHVPLEIRTPAGAVAGTSTPPLSIALGAMPWAAAALAALNPAEARVANNLTASLTVTAVSLAATCADQLGRGRIAAE